MSEKQFVPSVEDVHSVAESVGISELSGEEINSVLAGYPEAQENDSGATWNLVLEDLLQRVVADRKKNA